MHLEWYYVLILAVVVLGLLGALLYVLTRPLPTLPEAKKLPLPLESIHLSFSVDGSFDNSRLYEKQSAAWRESMRRSGQKLEDAQVKRIILLHGTFVGSDGVNLISSVKSVFPRLSREFETKISSTVKTWIDQLAQDNGNFVPAYAALLEKALGGKIPVELFSWSSANHHIARLEGAIRLVERLDDSPPGKGSRTLLIGHSHARQVFALFTQLVDGAQGKGGLGKALWEFIQAENLAPASLRERAKELRKHRFDFVTLGSPVRYPWAYLPDMRALHIINHHGETEKVKQVWSFWSASSGDFVQQWGMIGSDNLAPTARERTLNRRLDQQLGKGWHTRLWLKHLVRRNRLGDFGKTLLIDYRYEASRKPNFIKSVFGHGIYTRFDVMQYQLELICKYLYS